MQMVFLSSDMACLMAVGILEWAELWSHMIRYQYPEYVRGEPYHKYVRGEPVEPQARKKGIAVRFYVYILKCSDGSYYTGHTDNLDRRLSAHQSGESPGYTYKRRPVELVFSQDFPSRIDALERERQIKGWSRRKKQALIQGRWERLQRLSRAHPSTSSGRT